MNGRINLCLCGGTGTVLKKCVNPYFFLYLYKIERETEKMELTQLQIPEIISNTM